MLTQDVIWKQCFSNVMDVRWTLHAYWERYEQVMLEITA